MGECSNGVLGEEDAKLGLVCLGCIIAPKKGLEKPRFLTPGNHQVRRFALLGREITIHWRVL